MSDAEPTTPRYADAADQYWEAGWRAPLPMEYGRKGGRQANLPAGFSGREGIDPSYADIMQWKEVRGDGNIVLRLPDGVIGIDVDAYEPKTGAATIIEAETRWGALPPTVRTTSRTDPHSGIRLYRIPPGIELRHNIQFPDLGIGDIEIVQRHHRYAACWPSMHPEGRVYVWRDAKLDITGIPHLADLPDLPPTWLEALTAPPQTGDLTTGADYDVRKALTDGPPSQAALHRLQGAIRELSSPGVTRHDCVRKHTLALLHLGKSGEAGVKQALETLGAVFINAVKGDRDGGEDEAIFEYRKMVLGDGAARSLAQKGILDWAMPDDLVSPPPKSDDAPPEGGAAAEPEREHNATAPPPAVTLLPTQDDSSPSHIEEIERGFWERRECLSIILEASLARMCSPWSVMAFCAARALHQVRPHWRLPPVIGSAGSLNWFAAIVDKSGGGKTISKSLASELVTGDMYSRNLGSGEGITVAFHKPSTKKNEPPERHEAVHFDVDEVSIISGLAERNGSTTMSVLKSAFSGDTLGFSYVSRDVHIDAHSYRMTMVVGVQPKMSKAIMKDEGGGFPQRFMWFPANDPRCRADRQADWIPGPIVLPHLDGYPRILQIPDEARRELIANREKNALGLQDAIDGHALFCREKFAYALALLDGRINMNLEDWELSGIAADVSTYTRVNMLDEAHAAEVEEARAKGRLQGILSSASDEEKVIQAGERRQRIARWMLRKIEEKGPMTPGQIKSAASTRDRPYLDEVYTNLQVAGVIGFEDGKWEKL